MKLTKEQRSEINRNNAQHSTGPKTLEGKARSRQNALKHGLRAETLALPNEDPDRIAARTHDWFDYYNPQSPAAVHLTNQCIRATLLSDRVDLFQTAVLTQQVREAERNFDQEQQNQVDTLVALLKMEPATAVRKLKQSSAGCLYLMARWKFLAEQLHRNAGWDDHERDEAIRLQGSSPNVEDLCVDPIACLTNLFAQTCLRTPPPDAVRHLFAPEMMPDSIRRRYSPDHPPTPDESRQELLRMLVHEMSWLQENEPLLHAAYTAPARDEAQQRALVLHDPDLARLFLRYSSEARSSFTRAYKDLISTLERDHDGEVCPNKPNPSTPDATPDQPTPEESPTPELPSPNEANTPDTPLNSFQPEQIHPQPLVEMSEIGYIPPGTRLTPPASTW